MSTRAWYEYYVIDQERQRMSLAMQFYKWGDGTPENALEEWQFFRDQLNRADGRLPIVWVEDLLREQLGLLYGSLPENFSTGAFLFLLQRAAEERSPFHHWGYRDLPKEQRPNYRLGFAIGKAMALAGFQPRSHPNPYLDTLLAFVGAGHFVRRWRDYGAKLSVLDWLQYLTQVTFEQDMGSIAGSFVSSSDVSFRYRLFIWNEPGRLFGIDRLSVELCDRAGNALLPQLDRGEWSGASDGEVDRELARTLREFRYNRS
jgi:hypothetical protein